MKKLMILGILMLGITVIFASSKAFAQALNGEAVLEDALNITTDDYQTEIGLTQPEANNLLKKYTDPTIAEPADSLASIFDKAISDVVGQLTEGQDVSSVTFQQVKQQLQSTTTSEDETTLYSQAQGLLRLLARRLGLDADAQDIWASEEFTDKMIDKAL